MTVHHSPWNEPGLDPFSPPPDDFSGLSLEDAVEAITNWFFENFEDPAHETPYNGREGGFLYIHGGPYEARDVIENVFAGTASEELIDAAVEAVEDEGILEWAPSGWRVQPPDDEEIDSTISSEADTRARHQEMLVRLTALEEALTALPSAPPGLGHNQPPEPIEEDALSPDECNEMRAAVTLLKAQSPDVHEAKSDIKEAAKTLTALTNKVMKYVADKSDLFVTEAVKAAGAETGKWVSRLAIWGMFLNTATAAIHAVSQWLHAITPPF